jgi:ABC-type sugar transport system permease subunit
MTNARTERTRRSPAAAFLLPAGITIFLVLAVPLALSAYFSITGWMITVGGSRERLVWLGNYIAVLSDKAFWTSVGVTLTYTVVGAVCEAGLGLLLALMFRQTFPGRGILRTLMILPMVLTPAVVGMFWKLLYDDDYGVYNYALTLFGLPHVSWLSRALALPSVLLMDIWETSPFFMLVLLAGLQTEDKDAVEAARIDGASGWQIVRYLTLPHLVPYIAIASAFRAIGALSEFDKVYMLTLGGPGSATTTMSLLNYKLGFVAFNIGRASAMSWVIAIITLIVAMPLVLYLLRGRRAGRTT